MNIQKTASGFIFEDNFTFINLLWDINKDVLQNTSSVELQHCDDVVTMLLQKPNTDFVFQTEIEHKPVDVTDIGGLCVLSTTDQRLECQTYFNNTEVVAQYYTFMKVTCSKDVYNFYGSLDGTVWDYIGNSSIYNANKIGYFLKGSPISNSRNFIIKNLEVYNSNIITIDGLLCDSIKIFDVLNDVIYEGSDILHFSEDKTYIDLSKFVLPLKDIRIEFYNGVSLISQVCDHLLYGGDIFNTDVTYEIYLNGKLLDTTTNDLGNIVFDENTYQVMIHNTDSAPIINKTIYVSSFSNFYRGFDFALLSPYEIDPKDFVYAKEVKLPTIKPDDYYTLSLQITKDKIGLGMFNEDGYRFKLVIA